MRTFALIVFVIAVAIVIDMFGIKFSSHLLSKVWSRKSFGTGHELVKRQSVSVLNQGRQALLMMKSSDYVVKCPDFFNASVGGHIRHILDHYRRVVYSHQHPSDILNYDERKRDTLVESNLNAAVEAIDDMIKTIPSLDLNRVVDVSFMGDDKTFEAYTISSSIGRELSFVAHHGVHHLATVKMMMSGLGYSFASDSTIGIAVSTVKDNIERGK